MKYLEEFLKMLDEVRGTYEGGKIAVLGSGPSLTDFFERKEDLIIGVNGAGKLLESGDYFFSADQAAHLRSWFLDLSTGVISTLRCISAIYSDSFFSDKQRIQPFIDEYETYMKEHPEFVKPTAHPDVSYIGAGTGGAGWLGEFGKRIPEPKYPNLMLRTITKHESIGPEQRTINSGGTSSAGAMQLAVVLGAKEIHLYGVEFSNDASEKTVGKNYFYEASSGEFGRTTDKQLKNMERMVEELMNQNILVFSYGPTRLENTIKF